MDDRDNAREFERRWQKEAPITKKKKTKTADKTIEQKNEEYFRYLENL